VPWSTKLLIDDVIPERNPTKLWAYAAAVFVAFGLGSLATYRWTLVSGALAARVLSALRARCVAKFHALSVRFHAANMSGDLLSMLTNDVDKLETVLMRIFPALVFETASLLAATAIAFRLNATLSLIVLTVGAPLFAWTYFTTNRRLNDASRSLQDEQGALMGVATEQLRNQAIVKAFGLENWARARFAEHLERVVAATLRVVRLGARLSGSTNFVYHGARFFVLAVGAGLVVKGSMTLGALVAFFTLVSGLIAPFVTISEEFAELEVARGALSRIEAFLGRPEELADGSQPIGPLAREIRVDRVTVRHTPEVAALSDVSLVIPRGNLVALLGSSGSGKSTLLGVLARLYDPDSGSVAYDGIELREIRLASLRQQIAVVPQTSLLFNASVTDNVALGRIDAGASEIARALAEAALDPDAELGATGVHTVVGENAARLSGGQAQRVALARALVRNASVLLLDEATASLDHSAESAVLDAVSALARAGRTIIFATHRPAVAVRADLVITLERGRIVSARQKPEYA
jgi:ABC-type multidrug transport system fused ATPase/permease subunit